MAASVTIISGLLGKGPVEGMEGKGEMFSSLPIKIALACDSLPYNSTQKTADQGEASRDAVS